MVEGLKLILYFTNGTGKRTDIEGKAVDERKTVAQSIFGDERRPSEKEGKCVRWSRC